MVRIIVYTFFLSEYKRKLNTILQHSFITFVTCILLCTTAITSQRNSPRYECPPGYYLTAQNQCRMINCDIGQPPTTQRPPIDFCIIQPTVTYPKIINDCPPGSYYDVKSDTCIYVDVIVVCPTAPGWRKEVS